MNIDYSPNALMAQWEHLCQENPRLRIRDAATQLNTGEAQLLSCQIGETVTRLRPEFHDIFNALPSLGEVMVSTRNEWAVIEKTGCYNNVELGEHMGLVLDPEIDLRLFMGHFHSVYAVTTPRGENKSLYSIQFFAKDGRSLHKVYVKKTAGKPQYDALVSRFRAEDQSRLEPRLSTAEVSEETPDDEIDIEGFQQAWRALKDTHEFFGLLRKFGVTRTQGLRLAPETFTQQLPAVDAARALFQIASDEEIPIMVFVSSGGCIEIHTGPVKTIKQMGQWLNVLDPRFNLHLNEEGLDHAWIVKKPTEDGIVTSVEFFDANNQTVMMCFGERKPGIPEDERWRGLVAKLLT